MKYLSYSVLLALALALCIHDVSFAQTHFADCTVRTADNATIIIPADIHPSIEGSPMEPGDEIAVLAPNGSCAGMVVWNGVSTALAAWGADEYSQAGGYHPGEVLRFSVWDTSAQVEHTDVAVSYSDGTPFVRSDGLYAHGGIFELSSLVVAGQTPAESGEPSLIFPNDDAKGVPTAPVLKWVEVSGAASYDLQVSLNNDFTPAFVNLTGLSTMSQEIKGLSEETTYYWRVRAVSGSGAGSFSAARRFTTLATHSISLQQGWNTISSYVSPASASLEDVFGPAIDHVVVVKDEDGNVFWPEYGVNDIGNWNATRGYKVLMKAPASIKLAGTVIVPETTSIPLQKGWNTIAYLRKSDMPVHEAVNSISAQFVLLKDNAGNIYLPELGIDNIGTLKLGQAYSVFVRAEATLTYPAETAGAASMVATLAQPSTEHRAGVSHSTDSVARSWAPTVK